MNRMALIPALAGFLCIGAGALGFGPAGDPALAAVEVLREGGCGGILPPARELARASSLDEAAARWAAGRPLAAATDSSGYRAEAETALRIRGPASEMVQLLRRSGCASIMNRGLRDIGLYRRGDTTWFVLASPYVVPARSEAPLVASEALQLVNRVRARGARCGSRTFGPAPPVTLSGTLDGVALGHASDMAEHDYFEHADLAGRSPADRVRAVGYRESLVGENIAYGPKTAAEVVQGWLDSPGHCENIMDPRFVQMGIAYAPGRASRRGLYWVQVLAEPKA